MHVFHLRVNIYNTLPLYLIVPIHILTSRTPSPHSTIDYGLEIWIHTRKTNLTQLLQTRRTPTLACTPPLKRIWSALLTLVVKIPLLTLILSPRQPPTLGQNLTLGQFPPSSTCSSTHASRPSRVLHNRRRPSRAAARRRNLPHLHGAPR